MSGAYVGRRELLAWINALCGTRWTRVEQLSSGAEACQVLHALFPGCVALHRVKSGASRPHEMLYNYKLLQQALTALGVDKQVPVDRLVSGVFQDNLEFLRWLKAFYDHHTSDAPAQPADARGDVQYSKRLVGGVAAAGRTPMRKKAEAATPYRRRASRACFGEDTDSVEMLEKQMESMKIKSKGLAVQKEELETQVHELQEAVRVRSVVVTGAGSDWVALLSLPA
jgi:hypothetical protein